MLKALFLVALLGVGAFAQNNPFATNDLTPGPDGITASVTYTGSDDYYQKQSCPITKTLKTTVTYDSDTELTVLVDAADGSTFKLPYEVPYPYTKSVGPASSPQYEVDIGQNQFTIAIKRSSTGETIFDTSNFDFMFSEYFLTFGTVLPTQYLYGLGERRRDFLYNSGIYTIWNKDQYTQTDYGGGNQQTYGCHPMYLMREASGNWHVVYLRNSHAMDFRFDNGQKTLQFMITGGALELKVFLGDQNPDTALKLYHNYINGWTLLPFWSHGYHQSKYGVIEFSDLLNVVSNFATNKIPIDVIWSDIDYMYSFTDFTVDNERYNVDQVRELAQKMHWVPIVDAGVALNTTADSYNLGMQMDVWIKSANQNGNPLVGVVWPGVVHWVDWTNPGAQDYWSKLMTEFYNTVPFSGIWLDMNEYSNFCKGEFNNNCNFLNDYLPDAAYPNGDHDIPNGDQNPNLPPSPWAWFNSDALPYVPGNVALDDKALSINGLHYDGSLEFNVHNLNGFWETQATYKILQQLTGERPFILSRSTHVGSGQFAAHWSGDNNADWNFLKYSIPCIFNFQLFGIPMTGDDICGFAGNTNEELCARWMQVGAFYPFMRNHMAIDTTDHYPYSLGDNVLQASIASLKLRYSILKFYYSVFVRNQGLGTIFRPVFFDFPQDENLFNLENQFLIGSELMVSAIVNQGQQQSSVYFPAGARWYDFSSGQVVHERTDGANTENFDAPINGALPVFIKEGSIVPVQNVDNVLTTKDLNNVLNLVVALSPSDNQDDTALGQILGISDYSNNASVDKCEGGSDCLVNLAVKSTIANGGKTSITLTIQGNRNNTELEEVIIGDIKVYGVRTQACDLQDTQCLSQTSVVVCNSGQQHKVALGDVLSFETDGQNCNQVPTDETVIVS